MVAALKQIFHWAATRENIFHEGLSVGRRLSESTRPDFCHQVVTSPLRTFSSKLREKDFTSGFTSARHAFLRQLTVSHPPAPVVLVDGGAVGALRSRGHGSEREIAHAQL